jgi:hypothetical protein
VAVGGGTFCFSIQKRCILSHSVLRSLIIYRLAKEAHGTPAGFFTSRRPAAQMMNPPTNNALD